MARQGSRRTGLIGVAAGLIWLVLTVANFSPAEARMRGSHGGFRGGFGHTLHGGFRHHFHGGFEHGFHQHPFRRNVFFFNAGVGGFFPFYPAASPYPAYSPNYYPYYSPCGYYDAYGRWVNAACPPYAPPVSVPY
jgi:hypothetical protein